MQRGILSISKPEAALSLILLESSSQDVSTILQRLQMIIDDEKEESIIEVNREEVEALLDVLPIPSETEDPIYKLLRSKLSVFVTKKTD
jgi:hypothetical protein